MNHPAIFFDWNGTLIEDSALCWEATNTALRMFGLPKVTLEQYRHCWAIPIARLYEELGVDTDELFAREHDLYTTWNAVYESKVDAAPLRHGVQDALTYLSGQNIDMLILSNHAVDDIDKHMRRLGIHRHFGAILANGEHRHNFRQKNKAARLRKHLNDNAVTNAIIVGDTEEEIELARDHGLVSVVITNGQCATERLHAARPDYLIHSLSELPPIAERIFLLARKEKP